MSKLEVGKTYQHGKAGTVAEIRGWRNVPYTDGEHFFYEVFVPYCDVNASKTNNDMYKTFLLPDTNEDEWTEVVIDSDGLVYQLAQNNQVV